MRNLPFVLYPLMVLVVVLAACDKNSSDTSPSTLPDDPMKWVCADSLVSASQILIDELCLTADGGQPLPLNLQNPPPLSMLDDKNMFDFEMETFLRDRDYAEGGLDWIRDLSWRLTGPYVGPIGDGLSFGTHPAVRVYYSPEVIDWLCGGRIGTVPDGAMIVKEMHPIDESLDITINDQGCMVIGADVSPTSWTVIIKSSEASKDGWYWGGYAGSNSSTLNPPILDRSAITDEMLFFGDVMGPIVRNPDWYPTGYVFEDDTKISDIVFPFNMYAAECINCHSSAENEMTFSSLDNIVSPGILFKLFDLEAPITPTIPLGIIHKPGLIPLINLTDSEPVDASSLFPSPLSSPMLEFLGFYDQLDDVTFSKAFEGRLPAETYDHIVSPTDGPDKFLTSDQCIGCHDATFSNAAIPNMILQVEKDESIELINLSPYSEWRASPMGLAGRDPIFFSQLQSETNNLPALKTCIENTCLHCHGVMGQRQLAIDTLGEDDKGCKDIFAIDPPPEVPFARPFSLDMVTQWPNSKNNAEQKYGALARDGISCTVCHLISGTSLGEERSYTGNFVTGPADEIIGPYESVVTKPMENALGITPLLADRISTSDVCSSCHNILLPVFDNEGNPVKEDNKNKATYEQTTHLEWVNSDFAQVESEFLSCQNCHMPTHYKGEQLSFKIANIESDEFAPTTHRLPDDEIAMETRDTYPRHSLHGLNIFLNQMFAQFPLILGLRQIDYMTGTATTPSLITGRNSMLEMAREETASVDIQTLEKTEQGALRVVIKVTNNVGHFLPSGVGFRRVFVEFLVRDAQGGILWASGRTNKLGAIVDGTTDNVLQSEQPVKFPDEPFQPHFQVIDSENQVQIYQEVIEDSDGILTTSFMRRVNTLKDNRLRGKGYDPEFFAMNPSVFIKELAKIPGEAQFDPYYFDPALTGADVIEYLVTLDEEKMAEVDNVVVTVYSQSIPPFYLQERFSDANKGPANKNHIERLYHLTSHLNVDAEDDSGEKFIDNWKLKIATQCMRQDLGPCGD